MSSGKHITKRLIRSKIMQKISGVQKEEAQKELRRLHTVMEDHLSAINENTEEIAVLFDYLRELDAKFDRLNQRLDTLQLGLGKPLEKPFIASLNQEEKKIFLLLYTEPLPQTSGEIASKAGIEMGVIAEKISSLISKGVPLQRSFADNLFFFSLDPQFKEMQARENLVNLSLQSFMG